MKNNSRLGKVSLVYNRNADLIQKWFSTEEKFDNSEKFAEKSLTFFVLFVCRC